MVTYVFDMVDSPIEIIIGTVFLYKLLGTFEPLLLRFTETTPWI